MADTLSPTVHSEASKVDSSSLLKTVNRIFTKLIDITKASESKYATRIILVLVALQVVDLFLFYSVDLFSKTKYTPINLPSGSTSGNNTSLTSYESEETRADDFTAFGSVHVLLFLALCLLQKTRYGVFVLPKTYAQIMRLFTEGFSKGAIMVSYCWGDKTYIKIPRRVASYFACTWIDIQNLIPGVAVAETCRQTAANAYFRIAFVSSKYLKSANCKVEFEEISKQPGKSILIAYPDITDDQISEYKKQGHFIYRIEETDNMSPMWVLQTMLQLGIFQYLWRIHSPAINGSWRFTVIFYSGKYNKYFLFPFITLIVAIALEVGFIVFTITITITRRALITRATIAVIVITLFLTVALLIIYVFCLLGRLIYGAVSQNLEDAGMLLIILQKILQIKPIKFYTNAKAIKKTFRTYNKCKRFTNS